MESLWISGIFLLLVTTLMAAAEEHHDYCIIGAGPGGLQLGYFLKSKGRDFVIFERSNSSGSFFEKFPRHRKLISVNKRNTGQKNAEFNFRHDWNSLISNEESLQMRHYSKEMFPSADDLVRYFKDYQHKLNISVKFNTDIRNIRRKSDNNSIHGHVFHMEDQFDRNYVCTTLIVATAFGKPNIPDSVGMEYTVGYESVSTNPEDFEGQSVMILGGGNSAHETAMSIYGHTNHVHLVSRTRVKFAWATHYVGDVRAVNTDLLDTYQLKSLDAVAETPAHILSIVKMPNGKFNTKLKTGNSSETTELFDNYALRGSYDTIIRCLGFDFDKSLWHKRFKIHYGEGKAKKFPRMHNHYESEDIPGLYYAGVLSHVVDFKKSAGGFIHGFRYTARVLSRVLDQKCHGETWPAVIFPTSDLHNQFTRRINEASGPYQMFSVLGDIAIISENGQTAKYIEEFPVGSLHRLQELTGHDAKRVIVFVFQYGANFSAAENDVFHEDRASIHPVEAHRSNFLHPTYYYYEKLPTEKYNRMNDYDDLLPPATRIHITPEDFITKWNAPKNHILPLRRFIEQCVGKDLRNFFAESCLYFAMTKKELPLTCQQQYNDGHIMAHRIN